MLQAQHLGASRLVSAGRGSTSGSGRYPSAFRGPPLMLPGAALGASRLVSAGRGSTSGSGRYPSAFRSPPLDAARRSTWKPRGWFLLAGAALQALDGTRARFGAPPSLDAARRSTWEPRGSFLLAGAALQVLDGARARFGAPPLMLPGAALGSLAAQVLDSLLLAHTLTCTLSQLKLGARRTFLPPLPALAFERCCKPSGLLVSASA